MPPARRDKYVVGLASLILKLASPYYRKFLRGAILYGLKAAAADEGVNVVFTYPDGSAGPCEDCGRLPGEPCGAPLHERCQYEQ
jgi:hypothetical protein